jgi:DNA mismatch repair protein MutS
METSMNDMVHNPELGGEPGAKGATPVMEQYIQIKAQNRDCLLFYRMGDFYELFFADAEVAARDLGIALTKRGKHLGEDIPMCGVPVHSSDAYLQRLIRLGHRVAVCEQMEDPSEARKRGSKAVVRREVVRLVTPGTLTEDNLLESRSHNFLAAIARHKGSGEIAVAWADISSGEFAVMTSSADRLAADLARLSPREIIASDTIIPELELYVVFNRLAAPVTPLPALRFDSMVAEQRIKEQFSVAALDGFGNFGRAEISALGGLLEYIVLTQAGRMPHLRAPRREQSASVLLIDPATRANLELTRTVAGEPRGSLLSTIDLTVTAAGSRCLAARLANPLSEPAQIIARLDQVACFAEDIQLREDVRKALSLMPDLERALSRLVLRRGGPRDLAVVRDALSASQDLSKLLLGTRSIGGLPAELESARLLLMRSDMDLRGELQAALAEELPLSARDGGFVRAGYSADLDENRALRDETRQVVAGLQSRYAAETGVKSLKIRHNNVLGYFIEIPAGSAAVLQDATQAGLFIHRQTVANAMRYVTTELASLDQRIAAAADRAVAIEQEIFEKLASLVVAKRAELSGLADAAAQVDVASALAELAERRRYVRPRIDNSSAFFIKGGRHPVVETMLAKSADSSFVANDCDLSGDAKRVWLLTGPNMAGKSTFLRQNALIVILAQIGSYVPATEAHIGTIDRLFSRVGASDDLARGRSTFMVEMVETAAILNQATERSFVILDEIGRGTSTFDGLSIAWATLEHLHDRNRCRTLFATHYHELTALATRLPHLANATVKVREWQDDIIFLHEVVAGVADRSYGIHVARLAGLPQDVLARAQSVLERLERSQSKSGSPGLMEELPLFAAVQNRAPERKEDPVQKRLADLTPDALSPREALDLIYELKALMAKKT